MRYIARKLILNSLIFASAAHSMAADVPNELLALQPFINGQTVGIVNIDLTTLDWPALQKQFIEPLCRTDAERLSAATATSKASELAQLLKTDGIERVFLVTTLEFLTEYSPKWETDHGKLKHIARSSFLVIPGANAKLRQALTKTLEGMRMSVYVGYDRITIEPKLREIKQTTVIAFDEVLKHIDSSRPEPRPEFEMALAAAGNRPIRIAVVPPTIFARAAEEIWRDPLPGAERPAGPILARGIRWIGVGIEPNLSAFNSQLTVQSANVEAANDLQKLLQQAAETLKKKLASVENIPADTGEKLAAVLPTARGDTLIASLDGKQAADFQMFAQKAFAAAMADNFRRQSMNNLKMIGLGLHNYHDVNKRFPDRAIRDKNGKPLLSWRVAILPYVDEPKLYKEFHLDEPWDSEHNLKLADRMPSVYRNSESAYLHLNRTRYLAPVGENLAFPPDRGVRVKDFTDGTSRTILIVEADPDHAVIWTKPEDIEVDMGNPARGLTNGKTAFNAVIADGSARSFPGSIKPETLREHFNRNGGVRVDFD